MALRMYRMREGLGVEQDDGGRALVSGASWDAWFNRPDLAEALGAVMGAGDVNHAPADAGSILAPIGSQEVWAAGVTYLRSREARMEESKSAGGDDFYDRVYAAPRPELFFKAAGHRVVGDGADVRIRSDSRWNVPEPELTVAINRQGRIIGYTIGNDMSSRDIEGENPLYLPQAKVYDGACAIGPGLLIVEKPLDPHTRITIDVRRDGASVFSEFTELSRMKRTPEELVSYLFRELSFPDGCYLMTGTGIVPPSSFTLAAGDEIAITIDGIGTLTNRVSSADRA